MERKNGFTLVEILISLALIGVLSVVAINTLKSRDMSEEFTAKRDKAAMNIEGVIHQAMFEQKREELTSIGEVQGFINEKLQAGSGGGYSLMRDGAGYAIAAGGGDGYVGELTIDVNGDIVPNVEGEDIYKYKITPNGNLLLATIAPEGGNGGGGGEPQPSQPQEQPDEPEECGADEVLVNGKCEPKPPECGEDEVLVNGKCEPKPPECGEGEVLVNGKCEPEEEPEPEPCPEGTLRIGDKCAEIVCPTGTVKVGNKCETVPDEPDEPEECPEGTFKFGDQCLKKLDPEVICKANETKVGDQCVPNPELCPIGTHYVNGKCIIYEADIDDDDDDNEPITPEDDVAHCLPGHIYVDGNCMIPQPDNGGSSGGGGGGGGGGCGHFFTQEDNHHVWTEVGTGDGTGTIHHYGNRNNAY